MRWKISFRIFTIILKFKSTNYSASRAYEYLAEIREHNEFLRNLPQPIPGPNNTMIIPSISTLNKNQQTTRIITSTISNIASNQCNDLPSFQVQQHQVTYPVPRNSVPNNIIPSISSISHTTTAPNITEEILHNRRRKKYLIDDFFKKKAQNVVTHVINSIDNTLEITN